MTSIMLTVAGAQARASVTGTLTSGMVGLPVTIEYDEAWEGLTKNLVCRCSEWGSDHGDIRTILNVEKTATVAHEVMKSDTYLFLGIEGFSDDGKLVIPTTWAECGKIQYGANTAGDPSADPELSVWNQLQTEIAQIKQGDITQEQVAEIQAIAQAAAQAAAGAEKSKENAVAASNLAVINANLAESFANQAQTSEKNARTSATSAANLANGALQAQRAAEAAAERAEAAAGSGQNVTMEPAGDDIPKVFFEGQTPVSKDEDELPLTMEYVSKTRRFFAYVTLKVQGDSSAGYPLKNFNLKMFSDEDRSEKLKMQFRNWQAKTHKYCLKKNWIDVTHVRNVVNGRLWGQVVRTRADYDSYPAEYRESSNCGAVDGFPIKVYVNGVYQGLYTWNIRKDDSMFNMDDSTGTHAALIADSANNAVLWRAVPNIDGTDWTDELNDTVPEAVLTGFRNAGSFVRTASNAEFKDNIEQYFYKSSLIDYYCFIYAIQMVGGLGKSQTMLTYDAERFLANIYDMDTTWALMWNGAGFYPTNMTCPEGYMQVSGEGASNRLYERLVAAFPDEIRERYFELRRGPLSTANIINEVERFSDPIVAAGLYAEEVASTTAYGTSRPSKDTNTIQKLRQNITERLTFADGQMAQLRSPVAATGITLSAATLTFADKEPQTLTATVEPDDTTDTVEWVSSNDAIATVEGGVVTPVSNGSCTITATAGSVSAECAVIVRYAEKHCTGIALSASELTFTSKEPQTLTAAVEPADTTDALIWESSDDTIAAVVGGVVTPRWNGSAIITAICGGQRAECAITVSGIEASPLDGVSLMAGYKYSPSTGALTQGENYYCTGKFRLSDGPWIIQNHGSDSSILVWDENDNFLGATNIKVQSTDGSGTISRHVVAQASCKYAVSWKYTLAPDDIASVSVSPATSPGEAGKISIDLAEYEFTDFSINGQPHAMLPLAEIPGLSYITNPTIMKNSVRTANMTMFAFSQGTTNTVMGGLGVAALNWKRDTSVSAGYVPILVFAGTAAAANAYFAENNTVLTFN